MAEPRRRVWCSCVLLDYLAGKERARPHCDLIINDCKPGTEEIVIAALAEIEVIKLGGMSDSEAEDRIQEFFSRRYVIVAQLDRRTSEIARGIVRNYGLKPLDASHVATAIRRGIPLLETYDGDMITRLNGKEGLVVRHPTYEGMMPLPGLGS